MKPAYFDLSGHDIRNAQNVFESAVGPPFDHFAMLRESNRIQAGLADEPRMPIPGIGWCATSAESGRLRLGLIEADATAT